MSDEKHENFDDIAWEVRAQWQGCENCSLGELDGKDLLELVDRFVAAHKHEVDAAAKRERLWRAGEAEVSFRSPVPDDAPGNAAKLREALGKLRAELWNNPVIAGKLKFELYEIADAALAEPPRK